MQLPLWVNWKRIPPAKWETGGSVPVLEIFLEKGWVPPSPVF